MTSEERSRAKKLSMLSQAYAKSMRQKILIPIMLAVMAILYSIIFATGGGEVVPAIHVIFSGILLIGHANDIIGDNGVESRLNDNILGAQISGTMYTGAFLCTLPFKAKDLFALRIREFEINIAALNVPAIVIHIILMLNDGMSTLQSGFCIALIALLELGFLIMIFIRRFNNKFVLEMLIFVPAVSLAISSFDIEEDTLKMLNAFKFLSGWAGIAFLIISPILISAAGEIYLKNKKDPSWNLK